MRTLYQRLEAAGFDRRFVRERVLPDWWDDSAAEDATGLGLGLAELAFARMLGFEIPALRDPAVPLTLPLSSSRLKRTAGVDPAVLAPAVRVAELLGRNLSSCLTSVTPFRGERSAAEVRASILLARPSVDLAGLVDFAWQHGIVVAQLADRPDGTGRLHGLAMFCGARPAIVLTTQRDSPPWLAYHLGHELGHLMLGHVRAGQAPILDASQDLENPDAEEQEANAFALEVLTGHRDLTFAARWGLTATGLAAQAPLLGRKHQIDPGTLALVYGYSADRMEVANGALKLLGLGHGGRRIVADRLRSHLDEDLPETVARAAALAGAA